MRGRRPSTTDTSDRRTATARAIDRRRGLVGLNDLGEVGDRGGERSKLKRPREFAGRGLGVLGVFTGFLETAACTGPAGGTGPLKSPNGFSKMGSPDDL